MARTIGIDLGTTTSIMTYIKDGKPYIIEDSQEGKIINSVVGIHEDGSTVFGRRAKNQMLQFPDRTAIEVKRLFGTDEKVKLGDEEFQPHVISAILLKHLKEIAEKYLNEKVDEAVITVPANLNSLQRQLTKQAGELAGLKVERFINAPTAAAIAYGFDNSDKDEKILVYDLGGGTFDVTILEIIDGVIDVICSRGNNKLGGKDFDNLLERYIINDFYKKHGINLYNDAEIRVLTSIKEKVEEAKKELSTQDSSNVYIPYVAFKDNQPLSIDCSITRETFESLIMQNVLSTKETIADALKAADLTAEEIDTVILVGGSTRVPLVKKLANAIFPDKVKDDINPDVAVALGAAIQAGIKNDEFDNEDIDIIVTDKSSYNLGVAATRIVNNQRVDDLFSKIIEKDNSIPCTKRKVYSTTVDNQSEVIIPIYEGDSDCVNDNIKIGEVVLDGIPRGKAGSQDIAVDFSYDLNGIIKVTATVLSTGNKIDAQIDLSSVSEPISGGLIEKYFEESSNADKTEEIKEYNEVKETINTSCEDDIYKQYPLYSRVEGSVNFAKNMSMDTNEVNQKKINDAIQKINNAVVSDDEVILEKFEMELTDILFEI